MEKSRPPVPGNRIPAIPKLRIGTCSWKYPSWKDLVYSSNVENYLEEYARRYSTVEVDQWFWSLFPGGKIRLPDPGDIRGYRESVPDDFRFSVKIPNSITLTNAHSKTKSALGPANSSFLSRELFSEFLEILQPMADVLGPLIFQFEYLNRQKMESQSVFERKLAEFRKGLPRGREYAVEIRNGNYLNARFLDYLLDQDWIPVFLEGYWMPPVAGLWHALEKQIRAFPTIVFRLHGTDREGIEQETKESWDRIIRPKDKELAEIAAMVSDLLTSTKGLYINVNNHFEGSAPLTIDRFLKFLRP
jgi:uncharacterized protein YecE (DUF72 family)